MCSKIQYHVERHREAITILLVEDNPDDRFWTERALEQSRVVNPLFMVENGKEALQFLRNEPPFRDMEKFPTPGIILLDLDMPIVDGYDLLQELKKDEKLAGIPVVVLTASSADTALVKTYNLGAQGYIEKPVTTAALLGIISSLHNYWIKLVQDREDI